jgi:DNA-binding transcriptional LysR family regulator
MELRHLRYFTAVAETCHFGQAAERLLIAQPALSQAIRALESELGVTLLNRTTRHVSLTPAGEFFLEESRRILSAVEDSRRGVRRLADGKHGLVRLGTVGTAAISHLPHIVRTLKRELPDIAVDVHGDFLTPELCAELRTGAIDLALLRPPVVGDGIATHTVEEEPLILALPENHHFVDQSALTVGDLRNEDFIGYAGRDSAVNHAILRACRAAGFVPERAHEAPGTAVMLALVAAGMGIALVPASARAFPLTGVRFRDIAASGTIGLALAWRAEETKPVLSAVVNVLAADRALATLSNSFKTEVRS